MDINEMLRKYPPEECPDYNDCCCYSDYYGTDLQCEVCDTWLEYVEQEEHRNDT